MEKFASQNASLDPVQRAENMKLAEADLAVLKEENRLLSQRIRCSELEAELGQQKIVEAQLRERKRQRTAVKCDAVSSAYRKFCAVRRNGAREVLRSEDPSVSKSKLARLVRKELSRQWACMSLEEKDEFGDGVSKQCNVDSTNISPLSSIDLSQDGSAPSFLAANAALCVSDVADNSGAGVDVGFVACSDAASAESFPAATLLLSVPQVCSSAAGVFCRTPLGKSSRQADFEAPASSISFKAPQLQVVGAVGTRRQTPSTSVTFFRRRS